MFDLTKFLATRLSVIDNTFGAFSLKLSSSYALWINAFDFLVFAHWSFHTQRDSTRRWGLWEIWRMELIPDLSPSFYLWEHRRRPLSIRKQNLNQGFKSVGNQFLLFTSNPVSVLYWYSLSEPRHRYQSKTRFLVLSPQSDVTCHLPHNYFKFIFI